MGVSFKDLRRVCQLPVRGGNDVAGLLFGDFASLPITKVFVDLRLSPDYASIGFLVAGLLGAGLQFGTGALALIGALLLVLYYVLDCVDGEVARYQGVTNVQWGYYDYLFHMLIKPLTFVGVAAGTFRESGHFWMWCLAFSAAVATLWLKLFLEIPGLMFLKDVLRGFQRKQVPYSGTFARAVEESLPPPARQASAPRGFDLGFDLVTLRALLTNFDIGLLALVAATAADQFLGPVDLPGLGAHSFRALWLAYYGLLLPLDFLDYLITYLRRGHFGGEMERLVALAHHFRSQIPERERSES